jgi:hypothetical protein
MGERPNIDHVSASQSSKKRQMAVKSGRDDDGGCI